MVSSHQTFGSFAVWNLHWHKALAEIWRRKIVALFLDKNPLNPQFAQTLLSWRH
jgi:hypothetical protein